MPERPRIVPLLVSLAALGAACGPSADKESVTDATGIVNGVEKTVIVDPNQGGDADTLIIEEVLVGRLVDVYGLVDPDTDPDTPELRSRQCSDFLVGENVQGDGVNFRLETDPVTQRTELTILADVDSALYDTLFDSIANTAAALSESATGATAAPPFPLVKRNAALAVRFNDLLEPTSVNGQTVRITVGDPPVAPFQARVFPDPNHGAFVNGAFRSTRVILDPTVTAAEAAGSNLTLNAAGLPPSPDADSITGAIRVPSQLNPSVGQFQLLRNLTGSTIQLGNNGPTENNSTLDVVRGFRSGGPMDGFNGFLRDEEPPTLRGVQSIALAGAPQVVAPDADLGEIEGGMDPDRVFLVAVDFQTNACAVTPKAGDLLVLTGVEIPEIFAEVTRQATPPQAGTVQDVRVKLLRFPEDDPPLGDVAAEFAVATSGRFESSFVDGPGVVPECFVQISPPPASPPASRIGLQPRITVRFSEPIDPESIRPFDNFRVDRVQSDPPSPDEIVAGGVAPAPNLREFRYQPVMPLDHTQSASETIFFNLVGGAQGVTDLAGNPLVESLPADLAFTLDPDAPTNRSGALVLRFSAVNEFGITNDDGQPITEVRGQFLRDLDAGTIGGREVTRRSQVIDKASVATYNMRDVFFPPPLPPMQSPPVQQTPLQRFGSRLMTVWRHTDAGLGLFEEEDLNVDVEGLSWAANTTQVLTDVFGQFEISLSHSARVPDDAFFTNNGAFGGPLFPNSGLLESFADNVLPHPTNVKRVVHPRDRGYLIDPMQSFTTASGTLMMPYPLNRGVAASQQRFYTWRDTAVTGTGGPEGGGLPILGPVQAGLLALSNAQCPDKQQNANDIIANPGSVPSLGLPLLMEFKCFPDADALAINFPRTVNMIGPAFRAYASGFQKSNSTTQTKNPDAVLTADGTLNQDAMGVDNVGNAVPLFAPLPGTDAVAYSGQLDLVVRVSRVHTRWFDTGVASSTFPDYDEPIVEPRAEDQPQGTSVVLAFRGADMVSGGDAAGSVNGDPASVSDGVSDLLDANLYDEYGDPLERVIVLDDMGTCTILPNLDPPESDDDFITISADFTVSGQTDWVSDIDEIDGSKWIQVRVTFVSNAATGNAPSLTSLALPFDGGN